MRKYTAIFLPALLIGSLTFGFFTACNPGRQGISSKARESDSISILSDNPQGKGRSLEIEMIKGKAYNHPTFVIWIEDTAGNYIQTLFITRSIGQGVFSYGDKSSGKWKPGEVRRPAALPYWAHKRGILAEDGLPLPTPKNRIPDAITGATPTGSFRLDTRTDILKTGKLVVLMEINQPWDWNEYWSNNRYPGDFEYKTSCQPAVVYSAAIDLENPGINVELKPVGHSHYSGKTGDLYPDLSTLTTALHIAEKIKVSVK